MIEYAAPFLHAPKHDLKHDMNNREAKGTKDKGKWGRERRDMENVMYMF